MIHLPMLGDLVDAVKPGLADDLADRAVYVWSPLLYIFFVFCVMGKQYVGRAIHCWVPAEFKSGWQDFAEAVCFVENTWRYQSPSAARTQSFSHVPNPGQDPFAPPNVHGGGEYGRREASEIAYYQWVPMVLALCGAVWQLPWRWWSWFAGRCGLPLPSLLRRADAAVEADEPAQEMRLLARLLHVSLTNRAALANAAAATASHHRLPSIGRRWPWLTMGFAFYKLLNVLLSIAQIVALAAFFTHSTHEGDALGVSAVRALLSGQSWKTSGLFPRLTMCDVQVVEFAQPRNYTFQCVLAMNMLNEKVFLCLWGWCTLLIVLTSASLLFWLPALARPPVRLVRRYLWASLPRRPIPDGALGTAQKAKLGNPHMLKEFARSYLGPDGGLFLRLARLHAGDLATARLTNFLWLRYCGADEAEEGVEASASASLAEDDEWSGPRPGPPPPLPPRAKDSPHKQLAYSVNSSADDGFMEEERKISTPQSPPPPPPPPLVATSPPPTYSSSAFPPRPNPRPSHF